MDYLGTTLDVKTTGVDFGRRIVTGHAAVFGNLDRVGDILDPAAFTKTLQEKQLRDIGVFIGHDSAKISIGMPEVIRPDGHGLYTETYIWEGPEGDGFLRKTADMLARGRPPGMSFAYQTRQARYERQGTKSVRRLLDVDLREYSFADASVTANPAALVTGRKAAGGSMKYRIEQRGAEFVVLEAGSGEEEGTYPTRAAAEAEMARLMREGDEPDNPGPAGKTLVDQIQTYEDFQALSNEQKMALHAELVALGAMA